MTTTLQKHFEKMGARAKIETSSRNLDFSIDIRKDRKGEFFLLTCGNDTDLSVVDVLPEDRHLLLMLRQPTDRPGIEGPKR